MPDYMFFMHDDVRDGENDWEPYLTKLKANGSFEGGSAIGNGVCVRKSGEVPSLTAHLTGYIRVNADDLDHARSLLVGNPPFRSWRNGGNPGVATDRLASKGQRTLGPLIPMPGPERPISFHLERRTLRTRVLHPRPLYSNQVDRQVIRQPMSAFGVRADIRI
ncbi:MAG: hypothetical protein WCD83_05830 [Pseudolabrys sp.]